MEKKSFGLDIGLRTIKAVWLSKTKDGFTLEASITSPSSLKGMTSESPLDEEEMAGVIKKTVEDAKITTKFVNVALPESQVYTKVVDMPVLSDKELSSAIYWEAEQHIPVPLSSITLAWSVLKRPPRTTSSEKMQVLMVGAPVSLINKYQKVLSMAGFRINVLETEILSMVRALITGEDFPSSIIIDLGSVSTTITLIREGIVVFTYPVPTGGMAINRAIETDFEFTPDQAEEYKRTYGISKEAFGGKIGKATEPILNSILGEVRKALVFYKEKYKDDKPIRQIILTGGTAKLPDIDLYFAQNSNIETVIANPFKILTNVKDFPKEIVENASDYTIAVGLALKDYEE
ncbi:MAG: hypothetical protein A2958_02770 [Candidatus Levybacteria bacterium RIFCSPLOWO2_01_FULL_38_13]|nr:MAG: hypothetical protein A2629_03185 [Candidatus Levybacteria bacterium RIFCSPHIGHO2_01_FULL_41_15]OGH35260.1 MAG: hypothetical protein A2958_02770 [Candidatus Levybacteria bacterium RIFCSPLOWO2_01_FULL_38_13]